MLKETLAALALEVTLGDEVLRPQLRPGDLVAFERHFGRSLITADGEAQFGLTEMCFLGWSALHRTGGYDGDFDQFVNDVDDIDLAGDPEGKGEGLAAVQ